MSAPITIATLLYPGVNAVDVAGPWEAFAAAFRADGSRSYALTSWGFGETPLVCESGLKLWADRDLPDAPQAHTLLVPGGVGIREPRTLLALARWLGRHEHRFERIASVCTGAYALAEAGLLDGRRVATHWAHAQALQKRYPAIEVDANSLFLIDGRMCSSGGVTAGIDLTLELIESDVGRDAAAASARELVVYLRRPGSQAQYSDPLRMQLAATDRLGEVCAWAATHLHIELPVSRLAERAGLSERQFTRRFQDTFGTPPAQFVKRLRLDRARMLLEQGVAMSEVLRATAFASEDGLRKAFRSHFGCTPHQHAARFKRTTASG
ncbi:MAG: helix-turn-helix domain-containing protein [Pseudomonadota bacterium]